MSDSPPDRPPAASGSKAKHRPRTTTACNRCRTKRGRCDGQKPICGPCQTSSAICEYELGGDKRKPYTKAVVQAMQLRIDTLEAQLAALTTGQASNASPTYRDGDMDVDPTSKSPLELLLDLSGPTTGGDLPVRGRARASPASTATVSGPTSLSFQEGSAPQVNPDPDNVDTFQGGLAINAHGELRFYGPTSSYRAVLADSATLSSTNPDMVNAMRAFSLTRAPLPTALPADPALPRRPPELAPDFKVKLLKLAFEYCFSHYNMVPERQFFADLQRFPSERTQFYSPFLLNVVLAVGCRYLDPDDDFPPEICGLVGNFETRGDVFLTWSRYLLDQEWYAPSLSTIRGLLVLGMYLGSRGFDGPCFIFVGMALRLTEDFGLNLGPHRLAMSDGVPLYDDLVAARRECFWTVLSSDVISSMYIGRRITFVPDIVDIDPPHVVPDIEFDAPMYRSSAFHWSSRLIFIASKVMARVYSLRPGISLAQRQAEVPELHLLLESWYHELPSHLRAGGSDPLKAPHPHILVLNMVLHMVHISLHRPFFRRRSASNPMTNVSTEKCLLAASNIVRLVKLHRGSGGLRLAAPGVQHAAFNAGTVLAISAVEDGISDTPRQDYERRVQAKKDLRFIVASLKEMGGTWTTAHTSAGVLEALMSQWEAASSMPEQPPAPAYAPLTGSPTLSPLSTSPHAPLPQPELDSSSSSAHSVGLDLSSFDFGEATALSQLGDAPSARAPAGDETPTAAAGDRSGTQTPSRLFGAGWFAPRLGTAGDGAGAGAYGLMFPSWDVDSVGAVDDFMNLLNVPESKPPSAAQTPNFV